MADQASEQVRRHLHQLILPVIIYAVIIVIMVIMYRPGKEKAGHDSAVVSLAKEGSQKDRFLLRASHVGELL